MNTNEVDILLADDSQDDIDLTLHALRCLLYTSGVEGKNREHRRTGAHDLRDYQQSFRKQSWSECAGIEGHAERQASACATHAD